MIRKFSAGDTEDVMRIWLDGNLRAHSFIPHEYWIGNFEAVEKAIAEAEVYVHEDSETHQVDGFIGLSGNYIEGIFADGRSRSKGIGKSLIDRAKSLKSSLELCVYVKNKSALTFYKREGFQMHSEETDKNTGEKYFTMMWKKEE